MSRTRWWAVALGVGVLALALFLPTGWYDALPRAAGMPAPPFRGVVLLQATLFIEGAALLWLGFRGTTFAPLLPGELPAPTPPGRADDWDVDRRTAVLLLIAITAVALVLRLMAINADLWLDEVAPVELYRTFSPLAVVTAYVRPNNHLLNTLLVKLMTGAFGEREWAIRLPAVLFGIATIPTMYWVARSAASRVASLFAALLLAVSYHHIFFSQNARGYSGYLLFSLLSTGFLIRGLEADRLWIWIGYLATMVLDLASLLHGGFVLAGHMLVGAGVVIAMQRSGRSPIRLMKRLAAVFGAAAFLGFQLYATMLPQAYVVLTHTYVRAASGSPVTSRAFATDFVRGLAQGFGPGLLLGVIPVMVIAGYGFFALVRRKWQLAASLTLPLGLLAALVAARSLAASPRFFLLGLPVAALCAVLGVFGIVERMAPRRDGAARAARVGRVASAVLGLVTLVSVSALPAYYRTPKQTYRAALSYLLSERGPNDLIVLVHNAEDGFRFYAHRAGLAEGRDFVALRSLAALDSVRATGRNLILATTFERALALEHPNLYKAIQDGWSPVRRFPSTIHDGETSIWRARRGAE